MNSYAAFGIIVTAGALGFMTATAEAKRPDRPWLVHVRGIAVIPDEMATVGAPVFGDVNIDNAVVPEVDISYFFDEDWSIELIAATSPHDVVHSSGLDLGSAWVLPPTLTVKYHLPVDGPVRPYIGAGINYTTFWNVDEPTGLDIHYSDSWGLALQAGVEIELGDNWTLNIDVKKIDIDTDVRINGVLPGTLPANVEIDPVVVGIGLGYRF